MYNAKRRKKIKSFDFKNKIPSPTDVDTRREMHWSFEMTIGSYFHKTPFLSHASPWAHFPLQSARGQEQWSGDVLSFTCSFIISTKVNAGDNHPARPPDEKVLWRLSNFLPLYLLSIERYAPDAQCVCLYNFDYRKYICVRNSPLEVAD